MGIDWSALGDSSISGWDLLIALLIGVAGWIVSIFVKRGVLAVLRRTPGITEGVAVFVARFCKYAVILIAVGVGLGFLGASIQPLLAIALIVAVVLALVLRGIADNFAAGVVLQTRHPIRVGDELAVGDDVGTVVELNGRAVVLHTVDGRTLHVPNAQVLQQPIDNHSERGARRSDVQVRLERSGPIADALTLLTKAAAGAEGVHTRESTRALAITVSPDRLTAEVQFWHHPLHGPAVTSAVVQALGEALTDASIVGTVTSTPGKPPLVPPDRL